MHRVPLQRQAAHGHGPEAAEGELSAKTGRLLPPLIPPRGFLLADLWDTYLPTVRLNAGRCIFVSI